MASVNKAILIGNLGQDPEVRYTASGTAVANFSIATTEKWKDKSGSPQEKTEWHKITAWGKLADICGKYLHKGSQVYVEGAITNRKWEDKDGNKRVTTEITAKDIRFLDGKGQGSERSRVHDDDKGGSQQQDAGQQSYGADLPF